MEAIYVLDHKYTKAILTLDALKDRDLAIALALRQACESSNLRIFLATVEKKNITTQHEVLEGDLMLRKVFDLEGRLVTEDLEVESEVQVIQGHHFQCRARKEDADDEEVEEYTGLGRVETTRWYRETVRDRIRFVDMC
jgi:hypothetical protein